MTRSCAALILIVALGGFLAPVRAEESGDGKAGGKNKKKHEKSRVETLFIVQGPDGKTHRFTNANDPALKKLLGGLPDSITFGTGGDEKDEQCCDEDNENGEECGEEDNENGEECGEEDNEESEADEDDEDQEGDEHPAHNRHAQTLTESHIIIEGPDGKRHEISSPHGMNLKDILKGLPSSSDGGNLKGLLKGLQSMPGFPASGRGENGATFDFSFGDDDDSTGGKGPGQAIFQRLLTPGKSGGKHTFNLPVPAIVPASGIGNGHLEDRIQKLEERLQRIESMLKKLLRKNEVI